MRPSLLAAAAVAVSPAAAKSISFSEEICRTALGTQRGGGTTTTTLPIIPFTKTIRSVVTPTVTITPASATVTTETIVVQSITDILPQITDTLFETKTFTSTNTISTTLTSTTTSSFTVTTTSTLDTTTIAASSGFVPLSSALAASGHAVAKKHKRGVGIQERDVTPKIEPESQLEERATLQRIICNSDGSITYDPPQQHGSVTCYELVSAVSTTVISVTARSAKTVTGSRGTVTSEITSTRTSILTEVPIEASVTITLSTTTAVTTTSTFYSTSTSSITTTSTVYAPQPTFYAACAQSNIVSFVDNDKINSIATANSDNGFSFGNSTTSAYDCCVQCTRTGTCGGSTFHPASGTCYFFPVVSKGTCDPGSKSGSFAIQSGSNVGFVVSDNNCGSVGLLSS